MIYAPMSVQLITSDDVVRYLTDFGFPPSSMFRAEIVVIAIEPNLNQSCSWKYQRTFRRDSNGVTSNVGDGLKEKQNTVGTNSWDCEVVVGAESVLISCKGEVGKTISWGIDGTVYAFNSGV